jgi:O-antigen/teichoic acid export membrane protein
VTALTIKANAATGVRWGGIASALRVLFMVVRLAVLARLLAQRDFGVMSMVGVVLGYAQAYVDLGLSSALIQKQERDPDKLSTIFWMNLLAGLVTGAALALLRTPAALLLKEPALLPLIPVAALQLPISALGQQFDALFQRDLRFKRVAIIRISTDALSTSVAIGLAFAGYGVWSLVIASLAGASVNSLVLFGMGVRHWPVRFTFRPSAIKEHLRFGVYQLGNVNLGYLASNIDTLLIGRLLGAEALGIYSVALRFTQIPRSYINPVISRVAFPVFAQQKDRKGTLAESLLQLQKSLSYVNLPLIGGMLLVSPVLVPVLYGEKWQSAVPLVQVLCILALLNGIGGPTQIIRTALGHVRFNFHWTWMSGVVYALAIWLAADGGLMAMVVARTAVGVLSWIGLIWITLNFIESSPLRFLATLRYPALATLVMSGAVWVAMLLSARLPDILRLCIVVSAGAVVYLGTAALLDRDFLLRNVKLLMGRR